MATNWEDYMPTSWAPGMPITQDRMTHLEEGVDQNRDDVISLKGTLDTTTANITELSTDLNTKLNQTQVDNRINMYLTDITVEAEQGNRAWTAITEATTSNTPPYAGLRERFAAAETLIANLRGALGQIRNSTTQELEDIYTVNNTVATALINLSTTVGSINEEISASLGRNPATGIANTQFRQHMSQIDDAINTLNSSMNTIFDSTGVDDQNQRIALSVRMAQLIALKEEVEAAHREVEAGAPLDTLAARFTDIENSVRTLQTSKINISDVINDLIHSDTNKPLSAAMGQYLMNTIGAGIYDPDHTVAAAISGAQSTAETNAQTYADTNKVDKTDIYNDVDYTSAGKVLDARQGKVLQDAINQVDSDYKAADTTINGLITTLRTDVNTIATELSMMDNNAITATNSKIDNLEADIQSFADELSMARNENTGRLIETGTRVDNLASAISHTADAQNNDPGGLAERLTVVEGDINTTTTGIKDRLTAVEIVAGNAAVASAVSGALNGLDARLDMIDGGETLTGASTLAARVATLEHNPVSATTIVEELPAEGDSNVDYLLGPDENGHYFYYKWIEDGSEDSWKLISGAGGGNTSGVVMTYSAYTQLAVKVENTDYYVIRDDGIHHYRWIPSATISGELEQIEIGEIINTDNIKRYRVARHTRNNDKGEETVYLDFYEFDYGDTPEIDTEDYSLNRIAAIELPKGGGAISSDVVCTVSYVSPQNQIITKENADNNGVKLSFFYQAYEKSDNEYITQIGSYTLKKGSRIIDSGTLLSPEIQLDENNNPTPPTSQFKQDNATTIDVTKYCTANEAADFVLTVTSAGNVVRTRPFHVEVVELGLNSTFNDQNIFNAGSNLRIPIVISSPERNKTIYVTVDEGTADEYEFTQVHGEKASSNTTVTIPAEYLTPGLHSISIHFEEIITGDQPASSNELLFDIACRDTENDDTILLSSPYRGKSITVNQYQTVKIPYYLYIPEGMSTNIVKINSATGRSTTEEGVTGDGEFLFKASQASETQNDELVPYTLTVGCQAVGSQVLSPSFTVTVTVTPNEYNIEPVIDNLVFDFNPTGYINNPQNEADKFWRDENNSSIRLSEVEGKNFDWDNGGWKYDDETEAPYFCVKAGSRAQINYSLFQDDMEAAGSEFKCIFKAVNVRDPEAIFLTSLDQNTSTVIEYSSDITADDQDTEDDSTLLSSYLNVKEGHVLTYKKGKVSEDKLAITAIDETSIISNDTSFVMTSADFDAALLAAKNKVIKKNTTDYATKILGYVNAYDGAEASALATLITQEKLLDATQAQNISNTLSEGNDWTAFRETSTYANIMVDLPTLIKNLALTYDTSIVVTNNFLSMTITDDHTDEYELRVVKNVHAVKTNGDAIDTQVEINYKLDDNQQKIYNTIALARKVLSESEHALGLEMRAHRANIHLGSGTLTYPYSENDIIEFEYNVSNPLLRKKTAPILMYEDGVPSASMLYATGTNALVQGNKGNLIIGSDDCDIWIYRMKFYNKKLDNIEILSNFYADALNPEDMIGRYEKNIATYTDSSDPDSITPQSIAAACPDLRVIMIEAPNLTGGKNSFIKNTKIRCIYKGEDARPEDNWVALNAYHAGQGTSSDAYGAAGRNLDIIFGFNGVDQLIAPKAKNNYRFDPTYKSILITGIDNDDNDIGTMDDYLDEILDNLNENKVEGQEGYTTREELLEEDDFTDGNMHMYLNGTGKVNFTDDSIPNAWFNIKLNIASSENTNNALLQKRFDRYLPYTTPAKRRDSRIKNDMEFFNTIVFLKETGTPTEFTKDGEKNQWHFYGIGNIGDSKKTDDTRVNIPGDPNEFCVEVTDNGLTNSGFSTGVYWTDSTKTETTFTAAGSYEMKYPITLEEWENENNKAHAALTDYEEDGGWDKSFEFRYDISTKDGNTIADSAAEKALAAARQEHNKEVFANMYQWVVTADKEGANSFENHLRDWFIEESPLYWYLFTERYTMIDSRAKNSFYHWGKVYVSAEEIDGDTAEECTRVSELRTLLDAALAGDDEAAIAEAQTAYDTAVYVWQNKDCFVFEGDRPGSYANAAHINNGYRFELWDYDNDTALGINNNGQMVFDAGLEDIDRTANAWVYNEATSVFWRRIRNETYDKLRAVYTSCKETCFNAENLIEEFDAWQEQFPENLWRMDFERKYYRPYYEGNNMRYLRDMANGRKKYQRREFERNMCIYIDSKYVLTDAYNPKDFIQFRPTTQQNDNQDKMVNITLYSPMYINFSIGNQSNTPGSHVRCMAGETKSFDFFAGITDAQNIQTKIFNASRIKEITGLENYYADDLDFTAASKLRKITLGSDVANIVNAQGEVVSTIPYRNNNTKTLVLGEGNPILEELDIRNCIALSPVLDLQECISLSKLYATGTPLTQVNLAPGGLMKELYLPASMTTLDFNNLYLLDTVQLAGTSNLISYKSHNIFKYNAKSLIYQILPNLTRLEMNDINWTIGNIDELEQFKQKQNALGNKMSIAGNVKVIGNYSEIEVMDYDNFWNHKININVDDGELQARTKIIYKYDDYYDDDNNLITGTEIYTLYVPTGDSVPDIWKYWDAVNQIEVTILSDLGWTNPPSRAATRRTTYQFGTQTDNRYDYYSGWQYDGQHLSSAPPAEGNTMILKTWFKENTRKYNIRWYLKKDDNNNPIDFIQMSNPIEYGEGYDQEVPTVKDIQNTPGLTNKTATVTVNDNIADYEIFDGWERLPTNIDPDGSSDYFDIYAKWKTGRIVLNAEAFSDVNNLSPEKLLVLSALTSTKRAEYGITVTQTINYTMGHDYDENCENSTLIRNPQSSSTPKSTIFRFDRNDNPYVINSIKPFATNNGWTFAIDYSFMPDVTYDNPSNNFYPNAAVLAGCYDVVEGAGGTSSIVGFALYNNLPRGAQSGFGSVGPCIGFGDMFNSGGQSVQLGNSNTEGERNIVVLRKPNNSESLFVYSGKNGILSLVTEITGAQRNWNKVLSNASLELGQLSHSSLSSIVTRAKGTIYWAKYWPEDLGISMCKQIAAWPHEEMTFGIAASNSSPTPANRLTPSNVALTLTALSGFNHGTVAQGAAGKNEGDITGWATSTARTLCNSRIFNGLPLRLQSIICQTPVSTRNLLVTKDGGGTNQYSLSNPVSTRDYIYVPSVSNYVTNSDYQQEGGLFPWANAANISVYTYNTEGSIFGTGSANACYKNLRFPGCPTPLSSLRVLNIIGNVSNLKTLVTSGNSPMNNLREGDIVIDNGNAAYMYVSSNSITNKGLQVEPSSGKFDTDGSGGWLKAQTHWTRSIDKNGSTNNYFIFVDNEIGTLQYTNPGTAGLNLNYSFSV